MGATTALKVAERSEGQVTPPEGTLAVTLTCFVPVAAPLTVYELLAPPEAVPAGPAHV
jgi:hypothetical protein